MILINLLEVPVYDTITLGTIIVKGLAHYENLPMQYTKIFSAVKIVNFIRKMTFFLCLLQNIDCGYTLEPPRVYPCIPQFCYIKVGFKGIFIARTCFLMFKALKQYICEDKMCIGHTLYTRMIVYLLIVQPGIVLIRLLPLSF